MFNLLTFQINSNSDNSYKEKCENLIQFSSENRFIQLSLINNTEINTTIDYAPSNNGKDLDFLLCNCDGSLSLDHIVKKSSNLMDKIKHSPIISYRLDVENNSKLLVTPSKLIPFLTIVGLFLIAKIYLKLYSFCSNPSTTLNTRINPII